MNGSCALAGGMAALSAAAFAASWWAYGRVLRVAVEKGITDNPEERKLQKEPVPVLGGSAVAFGVVAAAVACGAFLDVSPLCPPLCAMLLMHRVGVMDDVLGLSPRLRLAVEALAVLALACATGYALDDLRGLWGAGPLPAWAALPLTAFAGAGVINAVNMIDGVNGLCSGYCLFACAVFGAHFAACGETGGAYLAAACAGALAPFLLHNVFGLKSKMFIGDGGTMLMGMAMAYFVLGCVGGGAAASPGAIPDGMGLAPFCLSVLSVPVFDAVRVMTARMLRGRSPFKPDRTHLHHLLFSLHFSHVGTTCTEILLGALVVGAWRLAYALGASVDVQLYAVLAAGFCSTSGLCGLVALARSRRPGLYAALLRFGDRTHVGHSRWFLKVRDWMDN